jgi:hypothetical protein
MLLKKGHIRLIAGHKIPSVEELKRRRYYKYHDSSTRHTNDCKILCDHIQKAIERGMIGLEKNKKKMHIDENPFPQSMVAIALPRGNIRILTLEKAKVVEIVDLESQITAEEYREVRRRRHR